jgi:hypothetical protein
MLNNSLRLSNHFSFGKINKMKNTRLRLGITTFAETLSNPKTGKLISQDLRLQQIIEEVKLAEKVGLDYYGVGEHHRKEFAASAPAVILAAADGSIRGLSANAISFNDCPWCRW